MKHVKNTALAALIKGVSMIALGIIHNILAFFIFGDKLGTMLTPELYTEFMLWFCMGGTFFIFIGIIDILTYRGLKNQMKWAWNMALASAICTCCSSVAGIIVFMEGPPFFIAFVGIIELFPLILYRKEFAHSQAVN